MGIENPEENIEASIYPNPADNIIYLKLDGSQHTYEIQMLGLTGKVIMNRTISNTTSDYIQQINTGDLENGFYFLKITNGTNTITRKLIVRH